MANATAENDDGRFDTSPEEQATKLLPGGGDESLPVGVDDEDWESYSSEGDIVSRGMEWEDFREDVQARGGSGCVALHTGWRPNASGRPALSSSTMQPQGKKVQALDGRVRTAPLRARLDSSEDVQLPRTVANSVRESARREASERVRVTEKADRATVEQALDPRTRLVLFKMLNQGVFCEINGCISTGKEANVYHASTAEGRHLAVKACLALLLPSLLLSAIRVQVYKTSILVFKDRDRYVSGDWRFRNGYCRHNPRKMVRTWAEKEMRNLARLREAGIFAPEPRMLRAHVLVMDFIGKAGYPAPRLKARPSRALRAGRSSRAGAGCGRAALPAAGAVHGAGAIRAHHVPGVPPGARGPERVQHPLFRGPAGHHRRVAGATAVSGCEPAADWLSSSSAVGGPGPPALLRLSEGGPEARERLFRAQG
jgi:serine/threonine-protein kinase RIO1